MNCPNCKNPVSDPTSSFCDNCGFKLPAIGAVMNHPTSLASDPARQPQVPQPQSLATPGSVACAACGAANLFGAAFCVNCGKPLSGQAPAVAVAGPTASAAVGQQATAAPNITPAPAGGLFASVAGRFKVQATGESIAIPAGRTEVLVGRQDPVSGVFPDVDLEEHDGLSSGVGRKHARLTAQDGQVFIEDLNSVNHTRVRGQRLPPGQKQPLNHGDEVVLGKLKLTYYSS